MARIEKRIEAGGIYRLNASRSKKVPAEGDKTDFDPMAKLNQARELRRSRRGSDVEIQ
ncbi:hypothetical protein KGP26_30140 (plasmid) [Serratia sp. JSRIV002]|uniref:Uncharacterized protein n=1 Tax=Serratia silvae TaxID=2824122 RepID=A0ABT0KHD1_9GAMM|nr:MULTISPECIES: hypothetical protein [Serratia]MCL1031347.1 hypothetical protein [Serratia silvae]UAN54717.1 hypothetical protein KGP26_30140 [Serratia sp. JSRIV002]